MTRPVLTAANRAEAVQAITIQPTEALTIPAVVEHLEGIVGGLERPPIIMGHSFGGVLTQILLDHGFGAAGVAIDSVPAEGIKVVPPSQIDLVFLLFLPPLLYIAAFDSSMLRHGGYRRRARWACCRPGCHLAASPPKPRRRAWSKWRSSGRITGR